MKKSRFLLSTTVLLLTMLLFSMVALGQPVRTTKAITLYLRPNLKAAAPTYPPVNSLLTIIEKTNDNFWKVGYKDQFLYMHESSKQYCIPGDTTTKGNTINTADPVILNKTLHPPDSPSNTEPNLPWYTKRYGVTSLQELSLKQYETALSSSYVGIISGGILILIGTPCIVKGCLLIAEGGNTTGDQALSGIGQVLAGITSLATGVIIDGIGLPIFLKGVDRRSQLNHAFPKRPPELSVKSFIRRDFNFYTTGLTLAITF